MRGNPIHSKLAMADASDASCGASSPAGAAARTGDSAVQALAMQLRSGEGEPNPLASLNGSIVALREEQTRMKDERKKLAKELKNAQRRKRRLKGRARQLSNEDLLAVLLMREEAGNMGGASSSSSSGSPQKAAELAVDGAPAAGISD